jgi:glycosyltransferase involved in cell wall biosynthesis
VIGAVSAGSSVREMIAKGWVSFAEAGPIERLFFLLFFGEMKTGVFLGKLKVAIDFRVDATRQGIGMSLLALAHGLSRLEVTDQEYVFVVPQSIVAWLEPHVSGPCSVVGVAPQKTSVWKRCKNIVARVPILRALWLESRSERSLLPVSDGVIERLGCQVVHFPSPIAYITSVLSIYQPWDLQHRHYPEFFSRADLRLRNVYYSAFCSQASFVSIQTEWGKQDLIEQLKIAPEKIRINPCGTALESYALLSKEVVEQVCVELSLPALYFLYPAVTWPHKNHSVILHALAHLKQAGRRVHVVFTGATTPFRAKLDALSASLGVSDQVRFMGFVSTNQMQAIFQRATGMLFPSRFEGLGLPILEAFRVGLPVICSSATVLPEVSAGGALLFDPDSPQQLADAMVQLMTSSDLRAALIEAGRHVLERYSADVAASEFAALYREAASGGPEH